VSEKSVFIRAHLWLKIFAWFAYFAVQNVSETSPQRGDGFILNGLWWLASNHQSRRKGTDEQRRGIIYASHPPFYDDSDTGLAGGLLELGQGENAL
jgi:hypothetical protein